MGIAQAALGTTILVPTVEGEESVEVKAGTQPGTEIRLRGRGAPYLRRPGQRGDLHVLVDVDVPQRLSREQREALEAYADASDEIVSQQAGLFDRVIGKKPAAKARSKSRARAGSEPAGRAPDQRTQDQRTADQRTADQRAAGSTPEEEGGTAA